MTYKFIPVWETAKRWREDPEFVAAYDALEDEFALAAALVGARSRWRRRWARRRPSSPGSKAAAPCRRRAASSGLPTPPALNFGSASFPMRWLAVRLSPSPGHIAPRVS